MSDNQSDQRRQPRISLDQIPTEIEFEGNKIPVKICDLTDQGVRLSLKGDFPIQEQSRLSIGVGRISPNIQGRVRWVGADKSDPERMMLGVEFEAFLLEQPEADETESLLDAWKELSQSYSTYESYLHILESLDLAIADSKINDISDCVFGVTAWIEEEFGPYALWGIIREPDGSIEVHKMKECKALADLSDEERGKRVRQVAEKKVTQWFDKHVVVFGESVVAEHIGTESNHVDLVQSLTMILGRRIQFWGKLLMKNIALQLLSEELDIIRPK